MKINIQTTVNAPIQRVWKAWTTPADIQRWNFASEDWVCPSASIELKEGGSFSYRMEARDGSMGFDFEGTFTRIAHHQKIEFELGDGRCVQVGFNESKDGILVTETFDAEDLHTAEQQRQGWQNILNNFKRHAEATAV